MSETKISGIEKQDIQAPQLEPGATAIVFQRHERYERDRDAENAGSLFEEHAAAALERDREFFQEVLDQDLADGNETMVLFISSDTQYAGRGYRSMETAQLAQDAAVEVMKTMGIDPKDRIINFNPAFRTKGHEPTGHAIRPDAKIREPKIFETPDYVNFLRDKYGAEDGPGAGLSQAAWAAHERDAEKEVREQMGAEGVYDMLDRTKQSLAVVERYAKFFHAANPNKRLVVWMASHYDTLSPLVKDATGTGFDEYVPVDYGAGAVIELEPGHEPVLRGAGQEVQLNVGKSAVSS